MAVVNQLKDRFDLTLLTGDKLEVAHSLSLPFTDIHADLLPQEKATIIAQMDREVMMVGDGINDALAFQRADIAVSFGGDVGDILVGEADVVTQKKLEQIPFLFDLAQLGHVITWQNMVVSLFFGFSLSIATLIFQIPTWQLAIAVNISALFVLLNCSRILLFERK